MNPSHRLVHCHNHLRRIYLNLRLHPRLRNLNRSKTLLRGCSLPELVLNNFVNVHSDAIASHLNLQAHPRLHLLNIVHYLHTFSSLHHPPLRRLRHLLLRTSFSSVRFVRPFTGGVRRSTFL